ncbi:MAG: alanine--tRNA ligase [Chloroflexota bacterium]
MPKSLTSAEIRQKFLEFFANHNHEIVSSSSLIPGNDPTLLFANAGMVQFKDVFLGLEKRDYTRATTSQKCMRVAGKHNDLDNVGPSPRHHTFFEMLGNFSFGDYFKEGAIEMGYKLLTEAYGLDPDRLHYTVYTTDDEAYEIWTQHMGIAPERVTRWGDKTNFWQMADVGPCGPTSEIHYDLRPELGFIEFDDSDRFLELWNLVFMQFNQDADGNRTPLPRPGVDTGLGLERIVSVVQNKEVNYETDLFTPLMARTQALLGHTDAQAQDHNVAYRVIADHGRAVTFMIGDGVMPGNEGRDYVLRLILRRAARFGRMAGFKDTFLSNIAETVIEEMGGHYTELKAREQFIYNVIQQEEERFLNTFEQGLTRLGDLVGTLKSDGKKKIPGDEVFKLHATYGFPYELTRDIARDDHGFAVDESGFRKAMDEHRKISGTGSFAAIDEETLSVYADLLETLNKAGAPPTQNPYDGPERETTVLAILQDGQPMPEAGEGREVEMILADTPYYVESGGQVSDTGIISGQDWTMMVKEVRKPVAGLTVHYGQITRGTAQAQATVIAQVDADRRLDIMRNHTGTHLLHAHLRRVLGSHVAQAGSLVAPDRLRFDFSHPDGMTADQLREVEMGVNADIMASYDVTDSQQNYKDAVAAGAMALFGEKYGDIVRVIKIDGDVSTELCGGTHVANTAQIDSMLILTEGSVAAGVRRIEAVTGSVARSHIQSRLDSLANVASTLGVRPEELEGRIQSLLDQNQAQDKEIKALKRTLARADFDQHLGQVQDVAGIPVLATQVTVDDNTLMREMGDWFRDKLGSSVIVLGTVLNDKPTFIAMVSDDLVKQGLHAGKIVKAVAQVVGGGGGGRPNMAQAGGRDASKIGEALAKVADLVKEQAS